MTNDKATRQAIYGALLRHVDKFGQYSDIQKTIDEVIDRLSELQPEPKPINLGLRQTLIEILLDEGKDDFHSQRIARRIELALGELQPVNNADEELEKKIAGIIWDCSKQWENAETDAARQILALLPRREAEKELVESMKVLSVNLDTFSAYIKNAADSLRPIRNAETR